MIPNTSFGVASVQVSQLPIICKQIEGYFNGGAGAYLQVHDSCITPAAGAAPVWQMPLNATAQFQETLQVDGLTLSEGLFVGVSSTDGSYTASASTMDITVWTDTQVIATNTVGDKTTLVTNLQVWSQVTGSASNKALYQLIVTNLTGVKQFVLIYAEDTPSALTPGLVIAQYPIKANGFVKLYFGGTQGGSGLAAPILFSQALGGTPNQGCTILVGHTLINGVSYGAVTNGVAGVGAPLAVANANILAITN